MLIRKITTALVALGALASPAASANSEFASLKAKLKFAKPASLTQLRGTHSGRCYYDPRAPFPMDDSFLFVFELKKSEGWRGKIFSSDVDSRYNYRELARQWTPRDILNWSASTYERMKSPAWASWAPWIDANASSRQLTGIRENFYRNEQGHVLTAIVAEANGAGFRYRQVPGKEYERVESGQYAAGEVISICVYDWKMAD
jgi:hypothetical protein